jgi:hypothetical protein
MQDDLRILGVLLIGLAMAGCLVFISLSLSATLRLAALVFDGVVFSDAKLCFCPLRGRCLETMS